MPNTDKFQGILTDRELGIIEDALGIYVENCQEVCDDRRAKEVNKLVKKLYSKFWEVQNA